jgi:hypothetical protein
MSWSPPPVIAKEREAEIAWMVSGVRIAQKLKLVEDEIWISFEATNFRGIETAVRLRLLIDIQVGENDGAPFYVDGHGVMTNETSFDFPGDLDFTEWWACAFPEDGFRSVCRLFTRPYRLVFAHWFTAKNTVFGYEINPQRTFCQSGYWKHPEADSCVLFYFDLGSLTPNARKTVLIAYGVNAG